jgi:Ankyrin repeats (3 copies)
MVLAEMTTIAAAAAASTAVDSSSFRHATTTTRTTNNACGGCGGCGGCGTNRVTNMDDDDGSSSQHEKYGSGGDGDGDNTTTTTTVLATLLHAHDWTAALSRLARYAHEARVVCCSDEYRTALHVACDEDAPAVVICALLRAHPAAACAVGTSRMTPLHITCSSQHASVHVVRVLLELGDSSSTLQQLQMRDVDGDTALHAACRCGAPIEVLQLLLQAHPAAVHERDYEGLTPLLRLWVRYFVILGQHVIENIENHAADLLFKDEKDNTISTVSPPGGGGHLLNEAWSKTKLLLYCAHHGSLLCNEQGQDDEDINRTILHAAAAVDCPRPVVRIAAAVHAPSLGERDANGLVPLHIACLAPIFKVRDLSDDGYTLEDQIHDYDNDNNNNDSNYNNNNCENERASILTHSEPLQQQQQPSVIEILLQAATRQRQQNKNTSSAASSSAVAAAATTSASSSVSVSACCMMADPLGRLPLHLALSTGKRWHSDGVQQLVEANAEAVTSIDPTCRLYPFMMAAAAVSACRASTVASSVRGNTITNNNDSDHMENDDNDDDSLTTAFELLRCNPTVLSDIITGKKKL